jgi:hypothetical protein
MTKAKKEITLYTCQRDNKCVFKISFRLREEEGNHDIYEGKCPYKEKLFVSLSFKDRINYGYYDSFQEAANACIINQQKVVDDLSKAYKTSVEILNEIECHCPMIET